jgi:hypothetical protein
MKAKIITLIVLLIYTPFAISALRSIIARFNNNKKRIVEENEDKSKWNNLTKGDDPEKVLRRESFVYDFAVLVPYVLLVIIMLLEFFFNFKISMQ